MEMAAQRMAYYPVNLDLKGRKCVVVGGGSVAERKVKTLIEFGAAVTVVAPELTAGLAELAGSGSIRHEAGVFAPEVLDGAFIAIAATDDREVNRAVYTESNRRSVLVNVADDPELCTFFLPAFVRRGELTISVSTSGESPSFARRIREEFELQFGPEYGEMADLLGELRDEVKGRYTSMNDRQKAFLRILDSDVLELLAEGKHEEARIKARQCI
jgi:precorrin-2 dehydrogenase/sirohydrochlorin ferrochelatase